MAYATVLMTNGIEVKKAPIGFSWTTFFWGGWPGIIRGDYLRGGLILLGCILTYGFVGMICGFFYNKLYIKGLFDKGYYVHAMPPNMTEDMLRIYCEYLKLPSAKDEKVAV